MLSSTDELKKRLTVLGISLTISLVVMGFKWWAYVFSQSIALKTDALESFINIIAIVMAMIAVYHAERPADHSHPYGHGKIEIFSSAIEGGMLVFAGCYLIYESIQNMILKVPLQELNFALIISSAAGLINGALGLWQLNKGRALKSEAIMADAKHILSDFYTSIAIILGLLIAQKSGLLFIDSLLAIAVAVMLLKNAYDILKRSAALLSDSEDPTLLEELVKKLNSDLKPKDIIDVHRVRSVRIGNKAFVDIHVVVPEFWDVRQAHDQSEKLCKNLSASLDGNIEFHPHVEPCMKNFCANCEIEPCKIRTENFREKTIFSVSGIVSSSEEDD